MNIQLCNVKKEYALGKATVRALNGIDFDIQARHARRTFRERQDQPAEPDRVPRHADRRHGAGGQGGRQEA
jgi:hypothetical protein